MKVGIILINWNGTNDTKRCISSLREFIPKSLYQILVIDNNSRKNEKDELFKIKGIRVLENDQNFGYTNAANQGIKFFLKKKKPPEFLLLLNNDTYFDSDFLSPLIELLSKNKTFVSVSPLIYFGKDNSRLWYSGGLIDQKSGIISNSYPIQNMEYTKVDWNSGCCNLFKASIFEEVGLLDEKIVMYAEDVDLSLRIRSTNKHCILSNKSRIFHNVSSASGGESSMLKRKNIAMNLTYVIKKHNKIFSIVFLLKLIFQQFRTCLYFSKRKIPHAVIETSVGVAQGMII